MGLWIIVVISFVTTVSFLTFNVAQAKPLPKAALIDSSLGSVDEAIPKRWISIDLPISPKLKNHLESKVDLQAVHLEAIRALIDDGSVPTAMKSIRASQPALGDPRIADVLIEAKQKGISVELIFDPGRIMNADFNKGERSTGDAKRMRMNPRSGPGENFARKLMNNGFVLGHDLIPATLYNSSVVATPPIMHESALVLNNGSAASLYLSTMDWEIRPEIDTMMLITDAGLISDYVAHFQFLADTYRAGRTLSKDPEFKRVRRVYLDGTSAELAFTNGSFDPNDRIIDAVQTPDLQDVLFMHFVFSDRRVAWALMQKYAEKTSFSFNGIFDSRFATAYGYGLPLLFDGIAVIPPHGLYLSPIAEPFVTNFVFRKRALDANGDTATVIDRYGRDSHRVLLNTNLSAFFSRGKSLIFEGSLGVRNDTVNAEYQLQITTVGGSVQDDVVNEIRQELVKSYSRLFINSRVAAMAADLAILLGIDDLDIKMEYSQAITNAFIDKKTTLLKAMVMGLLDTPTKTLPIVDRADRMRNLKRYTKLIDLYFEDLPNDADESLGAFPAQLSQFIGAARLIADHNLSEIQKEELLNHIIYRKSLAANPTALKAVRAKARAIVFSVER